MLSQKNILTHYLKIHIEKLKVILQMLFKVEDMSNSSSYYYNLVKSIDGSSRPEVISKAYV